MICEGPTSWQVKLFWSMPYVAVIAFFVTVGCATGCAKDPEGEAQRIAKRAGDFTPEQLEKPPYRINLRLPFDPAVCGNLYPKHEACRAHQDGDLHRYEVGVCFMTEPDMDLHIYTRLLPEECDSYKGYHLTTFYKKGNVLPNEKQLELMRQMRAEPYCKGYNQKGNSLPYPPICHVGHDILFMDFSKNPDGVVIPAGDTEAIREFNLNIDASDLLEKLDIPIQPGPLSPESQEKINLWFQSEIESGNIDLNLIEQMLEEEEGEDCDAGVSIPEVEEGAVITVMSPILFDGDQVINLPSQSLHFDGNETVWVNEDVMPISASLSAIATNGNTDVRTGE